MKTEKMTLDIRKLLGDENAISVELIQRREDIEHYEGGMELYYI